VRHLAMAPEHREPQMHRGRRHEEVCRKECRTSLGRCQWTQERFAVSRGTGVRGWRLRGHPAAGSRVLPSLAACPDPGGDPLTSPRRLAVIGLLLTWRSGGADSGLRKTDCPAVVRAVSLLPAPPSRRLPRSQFTSSCPARTVRIRGLWASRAPRGTDARDCGHVAPHGSCNPDHRRNAARLWRRSTYWSWFSRPATQLCGPVARCW